MTYKPLNTFQDLDTTCWGSIMLAVRGLTWALRKCRQPSYNYREGVDVNKDEPGSF